MATGGNGDLTRKGSVVIITDSRGMGLQQEIDRIAKREDADMNIQVFVWRGRGIASATKETSKQLIWIAPSLVIILAGICDVTALDRETRQISLVDEAQEETVLRYEGLMDTIRHHLSVFLTERPYKLVFCELIGADMARYNKQEQPHPQQSQLDEMVLEINARIVGFNKENGVATPWTAKSVHHNKKSKTKVARYQKMGPDGLHFSEELKEKVAEVLYKYVKKALLE